MSYKSSSYQPKNIRCQICDNKFNSPTALRSQKKINHSENRKIFVFDVCSKKSKSKSYITGEKLGKPLAWPESDPMWQW